MGTTGTPGQHHHGPTNNIYSYQRLQPYRGGHAVPVPGGGTAIDTRYGFTEQVAAATVAGSNSGNAGNFGTQAPSRNPSSTRSACPTRGPSPTRGRRIQNSRSSGTTSRSTTATSPAWPS